MLPWSRSRTFLLSNVLYWSHCIYKSSHAGKDDRQVCKGNLWGGLVCFLISMWFTQHLLCFLGLTSCFSSCTLSCLFLPRWISSSSSHLAPNVKFWKIKKTFFKFYLDYTIKWSLNYILNISNAIFWAVRWSYKQRRLTGSWLVTVAVCWAPYSTSHSSCSIFWLFFNLDRWHWDLGWVLVAMDCFWFIFSSWDMLVCMSV